MEYRFKKCEDGYLEFYTPDNKVARIKVVNGVDEREVTLRFRRDNDDTWNYHRPNKKFNSSIDVILHILENLESDYLVCEVL